MKTHKRLWQDFISQENFDLAAKKAVKSKKTRKAVQRFLNNRTELLEILRQNVMHQRFRTSQYKTFIIREPKQRIIYNLPLYPDHILHHALINILGPIWQRMFIRDSYACIPGKGLHAASQRTMEFVRKNKYVLQCDIRKFYPSIDHKIMMDIVEKKIHDRRILALLNEIVWSVGGAKNLPIGNLTSQWLGNVYMNELDHFVKEKLGWHNYIRYCDDFCLYGNDKKELKEKLEIIKDFLDQKLKLTLSRGAIHQTRLGVTFIGYKHFPTHKKLRKWTAKKIKTRIKNIINHNDFTAHAVGQIAAAYGWAKWACSFNYRQRLCKIASRKSWHMGRFIRKRLMGWE